MNIVKTVAVLLLLVFAAVFTLSTRYEIAVLGKSRDACLRLDKWTGKVELAPIDTDAYKQWIELYSSELKNKAK